MMIKSKSNNFKTIIFVTLLLLISKLSIGQINTPILTCVPLLDEWPRFTVKFNGVNADVNIKGANHKAKYAITYLHKSGDTWVGYKSSVVEIYITPYNNYVSIENPKGDTISTAFCK